MTIKEFVNKYNAMATANLKEKFFRGNIEIKPYLPFILKTALADKLAKTTMIDSKTSDIKVKSDMHYLLFYMVIIQNYTNLTVETDGFYEEYDMLNSSGILRKIMEMIPDEEKKEFRMLCDMKRDDLLYNYGSTQGFINRIIDKFAQLLSPAVNAIQDQITNMSAEERKELRDDINKIVKFNS